MACSAVEIEKSIEFLSGHVKEDFLTSEGMYALKVFICTRLPKHGPLRLLGMCFQHINLETCHHFLKMRDVQMNMGLDKDLFLVKYRISMM